MPRAFALVTAALASLALVACSAGEAPPNASGGAVTVYDVNGSPANLQIRWAKSDSVANGGTDTWHMFYESNSLATGTQIAWTRVPFAP